MEYSLYLFIHLFNASFNDILKYITVDNSYPIAAKWLTTAIFIVYNLL